MKGLEQHVLGDIIDIRKSRSYSIRSRRWSITSISSSGSVRIGQVESLQDGVHIRVRTTRVIVRDCVCSGIHPRLLSLSLLLRLLLCLLWSLILLIHSPLILIHGHASGSPTRGSSTRRWSRRISSSSSSSTGGRTLGLP